MRDLPIARPLPIHSATQTESMPGMGFEPTTPFLEWEKTVHALNRAATVSAEIICFRISIYFLTSTKANLTTVLRDCK
jgi:hypothetical protein